MIIDQFPGGAGSRIDPASAGLRKLAGSDQNGLLHLVSHLMALKKLDANHPLVAERFAKIVKAFERDDVFADGVATRKYDSSNKHIDTIAKCNALKADLNDVALKAYGSVEAFADAIKLNYVGPALSMVFRDQASNGGAIDQEAVDRLTYQAISNGNCGDLGKMIEVLWKIPELDMGGGAVKGGNAADTQPTGANAAADRERFQCGFHHCCNRDNNERLAMMMEADKYKMYMDSVLHDREETARVRAMGAGDARSSSTSSATNGMNDPAMSALQKAIRKASSLIDRNLDEMDAKGKQALADLALRVVNVEAGVKSGVDPVELKRQVDDIKTEAQAAIKNNAFRAGSADASQQASAQGRDELSRQFGDVQTLMEQAEPTLDSVGLSELETLTKPLATVQSALAGVGDINQSELGSSLRTIRQRANDIILDSALRKAALDVAGKEAAGRELVEARCSTVLRKAEQAVDGLTGADRDAMQQQIDALKAQLAAVSTTPVQDLRQLLNDIDAGSEGVEAIFRNAQAQQTSAQSREQLVEQLEDVHELIDRAMLSLDAEGKDAVGPLIDELGAIAETLAHSNDVDQLGLRRTLRTVMQQAYQIILDSELRKASADSAGQEAASRDLVETRCSAILRNAEQAEKDLTGPERDAMQKEIRLLKAQLPTIATGEVKDLRQLLSDVEAGGDRVDQIIQASQVQQAAAEAREQLLAQLEHAIDLIGQAMPTLDSEGQEAMSPLLAQLNTLTDVLGGSDEIDQGEVGNELRSITQQANQIIAANAVRAAGTQAAEALHVAREQSLALLDSRRNDAIALIDANINDLGAEGRRELDSLKAELERVDIHQDMLQPDIDAVDTMLGAAETAVSDAIRECRVSGVLDQIENMRAAARTMAASAVTVPQLSKEKPAFGAPPKAYGIVAEVQSHVDTCVGSYMEQLDAVAAAARNILDPTQTNLTIPQVKQNLNALYGQFVIDLNKVVSNAEERKFKGPIVSSQQSRLQEAQRPTIATGEVKDRRLLLRGVEVDGDRREERKFKHPIPSSQQIMMPRHQKLFVPIHENDQLRKSGQMVDANGEILRRT
ncbi:hypothetical protein CEK00_09560 [Stenotrophomonas maltophilia]|uniref:Uncharacterized protein n=2 Tax=Stenotrophomonas maltophilia TaxID=40324 RepID=A0A270MXX5_STEMA|nr:hypothetical protein CEK00_21880 [Stenotrophomonas maltophilia]PAM71828.1 hypothetical protein CEK00_09560 [Stenotrophomonas maltophilia]